MNSIDAQFWKTRGINHLHWRGAPEFYEGEDNVNTVVGYVGGRAVREIGCGYGRLAKNYAPDKYTGYDVCAAAVKEASELRPGYRFVHWDHSPLPPAPATMFINGPHLVNDDEIGEMIGLLCRDTSVVILAEPMGFALREIWKDLSYGCYNRDIETYDELFAARRFKRKAARIGVHLTSGRPYTAACWEPF